MPTAGGINEYQLGDLESETQGGRAGSELTKPQSEERFAGNRAKAFYGYLNRDKYLDSY